MTANGSTIELQIDGAAIVLNPKVLVVAGYTGADAAAVQHHIDELAAEGVAPPPSVPMYWAMPASTISQEAVIDVPSEGTSGEIELALVADGDELYLAAGSDHTCRQAEAIDIRLSKLICPTPLSHEAWRWSDVAPRWEQLRLASAVETEVGGDGQDYQSAAAGGNIGPEELLARIPWSAEGRPDCFVLLCGTVPCIGGIRPARRFTGTVTDPAGSQVLTLDYRIDPVPALG